jgi:leucyl-tRNA synthetase
MPQWAGSSWYFLRYVSPHCDNAIVDKELMNEWLPVDMYVGGVEHAVLHLLYARFWTKFLYDIGVVSFEEPFTRLFNQGMVCRIAYKCPKENLWLSAEELKDDFGKDNVHCPNDGELLIKSMEKMSKSKSNGVSPDGLVESYGTDSVRLYELFSGDPLQDCEWKDDGIKGCYSFLTKTWSFVIEANEKCKLGQEATLQANKLLHSLIKKVTDRVEAFKFNTAISAFMEFINKARKIPEAFSKETIESYLILLSPFAPHICEELWHNCLGHKESIFLAKWPVYNSEFVKEDIVEIIVQINGKYKVKLTVAPFENQEDLVNFATNNESVRKLLEDKTIVKSIVVPNKIVNFVVKDD